MRHPFLLGALLTLLLGSTARSETMTVGDQFRHLVDGAFDAYFARHPSKGTDAGFHQYDQSFEDYSAAALTTEIQSLKKFQISFGKLKAASLTADEALDLELMETSIRSQLLALEKVRFWERKPDFYSSHLTSSVFTLMSRNFAPAAERLRSVIEREKKIPAFLETGLANLKNPPRIYTEIALEQLPGISAFFEKDMPKAFEAVFVKDAKLRAEFKAANEQVISSLARYRTALKEKVLPKSQGDFRLGPKLFSEKLAADEMVDLPLDQLLAVGYRDLKRNQDEFKKTAARIDSKRETAEILADLVKDHPRGEDLLQATRNALGSARDFLVSHHIVTLPSEVLPIVEETPPFDRALTMASMDTPGAYETKAKEAYFNITLPEKDWPKEQVEEHLQGFNHGTLISTLIHEAYPGHYLQFLWLQKIQSKVRKLVGADSNSEGWAHYTEQMMLDEGYGDGDLKLRLGQLQDALLRDARFIVGTQMHTGKMTVAEGIEFFVKEGYQSRANGERETKRGTADPTYLYYTLGKLQIQKLRDDYRLKLGKDYSLQRFHDDFLKQGNPPLRLVRKALLGQVGAEL